MIKQGLLASAMVLGLASAASAATIVNGGFEDSTNSDSGFTTLGAGDTSIAGWMVGPISIDYIGDYWQANTGVNSIDLGGNNEGSIFQTITGLVANTVYRITFFVSGNPDNGADLNKTGSVAVGLSGVTPITYTVTGDKADMDWSKRTFTFTATSTSSVLSFDSAAADGAFGLALDDVSIAAVPVPAAGLLLLGGLGGLAALRRRRKAA